MSFKEGKRQLTLLIHFLQKTQYGKTRENNLTKLEKMT